MRNFSVKFIPEVVKEFRALDGSIKKQIQAGILKVSTNPIAYGKPLGSKDGLNLTGFFKIKYRGIGYRVVYTLSLEEEVMNIVVISKREDEICYEKAFERFKKYGNKVFQDDF
jgi:mRNA interferase RelE/StbE